MIQVWTINVLVVRSRGRTEKSQNWQKQQRTKGTKDKNQSGQNDQKWKYFNTATIKVYDPMITWYRCSQSTFSSCDHVGGQKAKMDKSSIVQKAQRIKIKADKTPKKIKYFNTATTKVYDPMITWYRCRQSTFSSCDHVGGQRKVKMDKSSIGQKAQRIKIKAYKTPKEEIF